MRSKLIQVGGATALTLAGMAFATLFTAAQTPTVESPLKLTATTENIADAHDSIEINLTRFSTDAESSQMATAWTQAVARAATTVAAAGRGGRGGRGAGGGGAAGKIKVVVPGDARLSLLAQKVSDTTGNQMPPRGPLSKDNIATILAWIDNGATESDFSTIQPILSANCISCHAGNNPRAGLSLDTLEGVMNGGNDLTAPAPAAVRAHAATPEGALATALDKAPNLGYLWSSEARGYEIHYAVKVPQPDGSEHIILITNDRLGANDDFWKPAGPGTPTKVAATDTAAANDYEFSIIELRLNSKGQGEGKVSLIGKLALDSTGKMIVLDNYSALPVVLKNVAIRTPGKY